MTSPAGPPAAPAAADASPVELLQRSWRLLGTVVAPATLLSAVLFYFGYVSSRAQYRYFGVDVDTIGLSTQDYVMRSPQALLVPLLAVCLGGAALVVAHLLVRRRPPPPAVGRALLVASAVAVAGGVLLVVGYAGLGGWPWYPLVTPVMIAAGSAGLLYATHLPGTPSLLRPADPQGRALRRGLFGLVTVAVLGCVFWTTATLAEWTGRGNGMRTARHLDQLPAVVLDTRERLFLTDGVVEEAALPGEGDGFRYRYRGLVLLVQGDSGMFLVPDTWTPSGSTLLVPLDDTVRVRFRFVDRAP